jgi:MFS transporter, putative metabolite transport protein
MRFGAILTAVAFVICLLMAPETKGKSLEEVSAVAPQASVLGAAAPAR